MSANRAVLGKWFQRSGVACEKMRKPLDFLLKLSNKRELNEVGLKECVFDRWVSTMLK